MYKITMINSFNLLPIHLVCFFLRFILVLWNFFSCFDGSSPEEKVYRERKVGGWIDIVAREHFSVFLGELGGYIVAVG